MKSHLEIEVLVDRHGTPGEVDVGYLVEPDVDGRLDDVHEGAGQGVQYAAVGLVRARYRAVLSRTVFNFVLFTQEIFNLI